MNDSQRWIDYLIKIEKELPVEALSDVTKDCIIDYLACTYAGAKIIAPKLETLLAREDACGKAPLIGLQKTAPAATAALVNAMNCHVTELDDGHRFAMLHIEAPVISALISAAAVGMVESAQAFFGGIVMGYEVTCRLAQVMQPGHKIKGFHATGTCATCGAALAIGFAAGFTREQLLHTLSAAVASASGLLEMIDAPSQLKPFTVGNAAQNGYTAACIGKAGFIGPDDPLFGKRGFYQAFGDQLQVQQLFEEESTFKIQQRYTKPYASCRHCHPPIEAVLRIKENNTFDIDVIRAIDIQTYQLAIFGHDNKQADSVSAAKMSIPFSVATALIHGQAGFGAYSEEAIHNESILRLAQKVTVTQSQEFNQAFPKKRGATVTIQTSQNQTFEYRVDYPLGEPENPMKREALISKFYELGAFAGKDKHQLDEVLALSLTIEQNPKQWLNAIMQ